MRTPAVFAALCFDLTDTLSISGEGRYQEDDLLQPTLAGSNPLFEDSFKAFTPWFIAEWEFNPGRMVYASYSIGNRPGEFNTIYFAQTPAPSVGAPQSTSMFEKFSQLREARVAMDSTIQTWAADLDPEWLKDDLHWHSALLKRDVSKAKWVLLTHFFNHQTHHRGQVHAMLTAAGTKPDDTDLMLMDI